MPPCTTEIMKMLTKVAIGFFAYILVGESAESVHCSTLHLRDGRGWERESLDVITIVFFFTFFLSCTDPPVIAQMLGNDFSSRERE